MMENGRFGSMGLLLTFMAGCVVGGTAGLLYAPQSGTRTRRRIADFAEDVRDKAEDVTEQATEKFQKATEQATEKFQKAQNKRPRSSKKPLNGAATWSTSEVSMEG